MSLDSRTYIPHNQALTGVSMKLSMQDLQPSEATFVLSEKPGKIYTVGKFSLSAQIWVKSKWSEKEVAQIFERQSIPEIAEITHHLLKDKTDFPTFMSFADVIMTPIDKLAILRALLVTIGFSQPLIDASIKEALEEDKNPNA
jgi:hypothetical protein